MSTIGTQALAPPANRIPLWVKLIYTAMKAV